MSPNDQLIADAARRHARDLMDQLAERLAARGIQTVLRDQTDGLDLRVLNHGAAREFGAFRAPAAPIVRTTIENLRTGMAK
jgi:hypothetical protein